MTRAVSACTVSLVKAIRHTRRERDAHLRALRAVKHWVSTLLFGHVALKRDDAGTLCVTLAERPAHPPPPAPDDPARIAAALTQALNRSPGSRRKYRHLQYLESTLPKKGWRTLAEAPPKVLLTALTQLDALAGERTEPARVLLRERLAAEVIARNRLPEPPVTNGRPSDFLVPNKLQVSERNLSSFFQVTRPAGAPPKPR
jgi:hypothetical protein